MKKPTIGITYSFENKDEYLSYADAIELAGGIPKFLQSTDEVSEIQGLILSGGVDIHPDKFDSRNEPGDENLTTEQLISEYKMECNTVRDKYEFSVSEAALQSGLPILGICRGFQLLNVVLGGSLIKDIRTGRKHWSIREDEVSEGKKGESRKHMITIEPESKLAEILGDCPLLINSRHHQGIMQKHISPKLKAVAYSPDGIIEAVESNEHPWVLGVQWHPEKKSDTYIYEPCKKLFEEFIQRSIAK